MRTACAQGWPRVVAMCPGREPAMKIMAIALAIRMRSTIQAKTSSVDMPLPQLALATASYRLDEAGPMPLAHFTSSRGSCIGLVPVLAGVEADDRRRPGFGVGAKIALVDD